MELEKEKEEAEGKAKEEDADLTLERAQAQKTKLENGKLKSDLLNLQQTLTKMGEEKMSKDRNGTDGWQREERGEGETRTWDGMVEDMRGGGRERRGG